jgi:hypothetical protein
MNIERIPPQMEMPSALALALFEAAAASARAIAGRLQRPTVRHRPQMTLRPGPNTPLWNELAKQARGLLRKRGERAKLARLLGIPRQRITDYLRGGRGCPDAERTLLLLCWVARRQRGADLGG